MCHIGMRRNKKKLEVQGAIFFRKQCLKPLGIHQILLSLRYFLYDVKHSSFFFLMVARFPYNIHSLEVIQIVCGFNPLNVLLYFPLISTPLAVDLYFCVVDIFSNLVFHLSWTENVFQKKLPSVQGKKKVNFIDF